MTGFGVCLLPFMFDWFVICALPVAGQFKPAASRRSGDSIPRGGGGVDEAAAARQGERNGGGAGRLRAGVVESRRAQRRAVGGLHAHGDLGVQRKVRALHDDGKGIVLLRGKHGIRRGQCASGRRGNGNSANARDSQLRQLACRWNDDELRALSESIRSVSAEIILVGIKTNASISRTGEIRVIISLIRPKTRKT